MNIARSFVQFMEGELSATFGTDIFIGGAPIDAQDRIWWVIAAGGTPIGKNNTGEKVKNYLLSVFYRNTDAEDVYETIQGFEDLINAGQCKELNGYDTIELEATTFATDQDIDNEDRTIGLIQVTITIYQN